MKIFTKPHLDFLNFVVETIGKRHVPQTRHVAKLDNMKTHNIRDIFQESVIWCAINRTLMQFSGLQTQVSHIDLSK
jgi:hypothetical protein